MTYAINVKFPVGTDIKEAASRVIGTGDKGVPIGEELNGIDVGLVTRKSLHSFASSNIPKLGEGVASTRDKGVLICWVEADAHNIAKVVGEFNLFGASLNIPLHTSHVAR